MSALSSGGSGGSRSAWTVRTEEEGEGGAETRGSHMVASLTLSDEISTALGVIHGSRRSVQLCQIAGPCQLDFPFTNWSNRRKHQVNPGNLTKLSVRSEALWIYSRRVESWQTIPHARLRLPKRTSYPSAALPSDWIYFLDFNATCILQAI